MALYRLEIKEQEAQRSLNRSYDRRSFVKIFEKEAKIRINIEYVLMFSFETFSQYYANRLF